MKRIHRVEFACKRGICVAPLVVLAAPVVLTALPIYATITVAKAQARKARARRLRREREETMRMRARYWSTAIAAQRAEMVACRRTGEHAWVAGWCSNCGTIDEAWEAEGSVEEAEAEEEEYEECEECE